jgi:hypothetical protein
VAPLLPHYYNRGLHHAVSVCVCMCPTQGAGRDGSSMKSDHSLSAATGYILGADIYAAVVHVCRVDANTFAGYRLPDAAERERAESAGAV